MVNLTAKENTLVSDLKEQEKLCIEKYRHYAQRACDNRLKNLFQQMEQHENHHLQMLDQMTQGQIPQWNENAQQGQQEHCSCENTCSQQDWQQDKFLCQDALSMEKHVSSVYDTSVFEFCQKELRDALNWIQKQEQQHGEMLYQYMKENGMYN